MGIFKKWFSKKHYPDGKSAHESMKKPSGKTGRAAKNIPELTSFEFISDYQTLVDGITKARESRRSISVIVVDKNTTGCYSFRLRPGDGYIVKADNGNPDNPTLPEMPMRIAAVTADTIELRGFPVDVKTTVGWQPIDNSDYGLTIFRDIEGHITKCTVHRFSQLLEIEHTQISTATSPGTCPIVKPATKAEELTRQAIALEQRGYMEEDILEMQHNIWKAIVEEPQSLHKISETLNVSHQLLILLASGTVKALPDRRQLAAIIFLLTYKLRFETQLPIIALKTRAEAIIYDKEAFRSLIERNLPKEPSTNTDFKLQAITYSILTSSEVLQAVPKLYYELKYLNQKLENGDLATYTKAQFTESGQHLQTRLLTLLQSKAKSQNLDF